MDLLGDAKVFLWDETKGWGLFYLGLHFLTKILVGKGHFRQRFFLGDMPGMDLLRAVSQRCIRIHLS